MQRIRSHNNFFLFTASLAFLLLAFACAISVPSEEYHLLLQGALFITQLIAYFSLSLSGRWRRFVGLILVTMAFYTLLRELGNWTVSPLAGLVVSLVFYSGIAYVAARQVLFSGNIELNTIVGPFYMAVVVASLVSAFTEKSR